MAIQIIPDIVAETAFAEDDRTGRHTRKWLVKGLPSNSGITDSALYASDGAHIIPRAGWQHERMPDFVVKGIRVEPVRGSRHDVYILIDYIKVRRRLLDVRTSNQVSFVETQFDRDGNIMTVGYQAGAAASTPPPAIPSDGAAALNSSGWKFNYVKASRVLPEDTLEIVYLEKSSPVPLAKKYVGKVNKWDWQGGEPGEWLCTGISGQIISPIPSNMMALGNPPVVTGAAKFDWNVTYSFKRRRNYKVDNGKVTGGPSWNDPVIFVDQNLGRSPADISPVKGGWPKQKSGNGWAVFDLYESADFDELKLVSAVE